MPRYFLKNVLALAFLLALSVGVSLAAPKKFAILVGVSGYPALESRLQLKGPMNDVALMRTVVKNRGFLDENVVVLADGLPDAKEPTRTAIMAALEDVTAKAGDKDYVFLYFAGHGSQQPEDKARTDRGHKPNGMNEIFLPRDVGHWQDTVGTVQNAIADFEVNTAVTNMRNKGAFVWAIFDSCHSASMTRGIPPDDLRFRQVEASALGVPQKAVAKDDMATQPPGEPGSRLGPPPNLQAGAAGFVAFYAAQTTETTPEMAMPRDAEDRKPQGVFSFTVAQALESHGNITYRQLSEYVLQQYAAMSGVPVTPLVEGTDLDAQVFGQGKAATAVRQWPVESRQGKYRIRAGALQLLSEGSVFAVMPSAVSEDKEAIAYLRVESVKVFEAELLPVKKEGEAYVPATLTPDQVPKGALARLMESRPNFELTVALPPGLYKDGPEEARMRRILESMKSQVIPELRRVSWVGPGESAHLRLSFNLEAKTPLRRLWLLSSTGQLVESGAAKSHSIDLAQSDDVLREKIRESLLKVARYVNLLRLSGQMTGASGAAALEVNAVITRAGTGKQEPVQGGDVPKLTTGDIVDFRMANKGRTAADVTLLFLDSEWGITAMYPPPGRLNRIEAGGTDSVQVEINADTLGVERMLTIAVQAQAKQALADFSFLAQPRLDKTRGSRDASGSMEALMAEAGFADKGASRGVSLSKSDAQTTRMQLFSWETVTPQKGK